MRRRPSLRKPLPPRERRRVMKVQARLRCPRCQWRSRQEVHLDGRVHRCPKCEGSLFAFQRQPRVYFHGGQRGLPPGTLLLPRDQTGTPGVNREQAQPLGLVNPEEDRPDFLYLTTRWDVAVMFAVLHPSLGQVYLVDTPIDVEWDPGLREEDVYFRCRQARVRRVLDVESHELVATVRTVEHFRKVETEKHGKEQGESKPS